MTARRLLTGDALAARVRPVAARRAVPLLVVRVNDVERLAWHEGRTAARRLVREARRAFASSAARLRTGDLLAHDSRSEVFAAALIARARRGERSLFADECRSVLARIAGELGGVAQALECGWTFVDGNSRNVCDDMDRALVRGARERQRLDFLSPVAHEMRTPLTAIRGYLQTVLDEPLDAQTARRFLEIARGETLRLGRLIDGMFAVSLLDLEYHGITNSFAEPLAAAVDCAVSALGPRLWQRRVTLSVGAIPDALVAIPRDHLVQIFANVVGNAIEHTSVGANVAIAARAHAEAVEVTVDDDGPGIPAENREAVFELGYRTSPTGAGIGLAVVRRLLERSGGIAVASESPLGGARITIRLRTASRGATG